MTKTEQSEWFRAVWTGLTGASTRRHPAPYPVELAYRLIRMFSFTGDTVLDPFAGSGTSAMAAMKANRNSICNEIDPAYFEKAVERVRSEIRDSGRFAGAPHLIVRRSEPRTPR